MLDWLKEILGEAYTEEIDKKVSEEIGKGFVSRSDFNAANEAKKAAETKEQSVLKQLEDANAVVEDMKAKAGNAEEAGKAADEWKQKYEADTAALKEQLEKTKYTHGIETLAGREKFSSEAARKAFIADLAAKELPFEEGKLIGYDDFKKTYQESDPGAFAQQGAPPPYAAGTGKAQIWGKDTDISKMGVRERTQLKRENPDLYKQLMHKEE